MSRSALEAGKQVVDMTNRLDGLGLGKTDPCQSGHAHRCEIVGSEPGRHGVNTHIDLTAGAAACDFLGHQRPRLRLAAVGNGVLEIENDRVSVAGGSLGELAAVAAGAEQERT
jgi:hypothetical protein